MSTEFLEFLTDQMRSLGHVTARRMFGGAGLMCDGLMFAIVADEALYLKADATSQAAFEAEGLERFTYNGKSRPVAMSYWRAPDRVLDDPDEMLLWAGRAILAAGRSAKTKTGTAGRTKNRAK